jgi:DNA-binding CsgD family transcriptional regulator
MSHSATPTLIQVRDLYRLVGDVRAITNDPLVQQRVLIDGVCNLFGADQAFLSEFEDFLPGRAPRELHTTPGSQIDPRVVGFIRDWYATQAVEQDAMGAALYRAAATPGPTVTAWHEVKRHTPIRSYGSFYDVVETVRLTDILDPMSRDASGHMAAISLHRLGKAKSFTVREKALAKLVAEELSWLHRTRRLNVRDLLGRSLPPRLRELMGHLLTDKGVKQIAIAMGLSIHTTREYVGDLYKRLGIDGREQLFFRFGPCGNTR